MSAAWPCDVDISMCGVTCTTHVIMLIKDGMQVVTTNAQHRSQDRLAWRGVRMQSAVMPRWRLPAVAGVTTCSPPSWTSSLGGSGRTRLQGCCQCAAAAVQPALLVEGLHEHCHMSMSAAIISAGCLGARSAVPTCITDGVREGIRVGHSCCPHKLGKSFNERMSTLVCGTQGLQVVHLRRRRRLLLQDLRQDKACKTRCSHRAGGSRVSQLPAWWWGAPTCRLCPAWCSTTSNGSGSLAAMLDAQDVVTSPDHTSAARIWAPEGSPGALGVTSSCSSGRSAALPPTP